MGNLTSYGNVCVKSPDVQMRRNVVNLLGYVLALFIGQGLYVTGLLAIFAMYLSWLLQISPMERSIEVLAASVVGALCGGAITKAAVRRYHLSVKVSTSRVAGIAAWIFWVLGGAAGLWGSLHLLFPISSTIYGFYYYAILFTTALVLQKLGQALGRPTIGMDARSILQTDHRPPVLYLRSFARESEFTAAKYVSSRLGNAWKLVLGPLLHTFVINFADKNGRSKALSQVMEKAGVNMMHTVERASLPGLVGNRFSGKALMSRATKNTDKEQFMFGLLMNKVGPYVAIMNRRYIGPVANVGAAKMAVADDKWQGTVQDFLRKAGAVVIELDASPGLRWEINEVVSTVPPRKVLLIIPRTNDAYEKAIGLVGGLFPKGLPVVQEVSSRLVMFLDDWTPVSLRYPAGSSQVIREVMAMRRPSRDIEILSVEFMKPFFNGLGVQVSLSSS
jgi:hypothetical protein